MGELKVEDMVGGEWYHYPGEIETIFELAEMLPPNPLIVNIGTGLGTSPLAFYEAREDALVFTIDIEPCEDAIYSWELAGVLPGRIVPVRGASGDIGKWWRWPVDLLFVDGSHKEEGIRIDAEAWERHVKPNGLLVFHDYGNPVCPQVKPTVDEIMGMDCLLEKGFIKAFRKAEA